MPHDPINKEALNLIDENLKTSRPISTTGISMINTLWQATQRGLGKSRFKKKYKTFKKMKSRGALKLDQASHAVPMRSANVLIKKLNEDVPDEWVEFIKKSFIETLYPRLIKNVALMAPYYGVAEFERVWKFADGKQYGLPGQVLIYRKIKYLQPENVFIAQDTETFDFDGIVVFPDDPTRRVTLDRINSYIYTWDEEASDNGLYGTSMNNDLTEWWDGFISIIEQYTIYLNKSTGASPTIMYPEGKSKDANGTEVDSSIMAIRLAQTIHMNLPTIIPSGMSEVMTQILQNNASINPSMIKDLQRWKIEMNESSGSASNSFLDGLRYYDHQVYNQWLILPRAVEEGKFGTKAESGEHKDLMTRLSKISLQEILQQMSETIISDLLEVNFGEEARGAIFLEAEAIDPEVVKFLQEIVKSIMSSPLADFDESMDVPAILDMVGMPRKSDLEIEAQLKVADALRKSVIEMNDNDDSMMMDI